MKVMWITLFFVVVLSLLVPTIMRASKSNKDLPMDGALDDPVKRFIPEDKTVRVYLDNETIYIQFSKEVGSVDVVLMGSDGVVFTEDLIDTAVDNYMSIAIPEDSSSDFVIRLSNEYGQMEGHFSVD